MDSIISTISSQDHAVGYRASGSASPLTIFLKLVKGKSERNTFETKRFAVDSEMRIPGEASGDNYETETDNP